MQDRRWPLVLLAVWPGVREAQSFQLLCQSSPLIRNAQRGLSPPWRPREAISADDEMAASEEPDIVIIPANVLLSFSISWEA